MARRWTLALGVLAAGALIFGGMAAAAAEPRLMVFYVEAPPAKAAKVLAALQAHAQGAGTAAAEVLREAGRPGRMAVVEQWRDLNAAEAAGRAKALQASLEPDLQAPVDDRLSDPIVPLDFKASSPGAFHVLMHIDVNPAGAAMAREALAGQQAAVMAAPGALVYQAAVQAGLPNHFAVHEVWKDRAAYEAYAASPPAQDLRRTLDRFKGAPFDARFY